MFGLLTKKQMQQCAYASEEPISKEMGTKVVVMLFPLRTSR